MFNDIEQILNDTRLTSREVKSIRDFDELYDNVQIIVNHYIHLQIITLQADDECFFVLQASVYDNGSLMIQDAIDFSQSHTERFFEFDESDRSELMMIVNEFMDQAVNDALVS